jgi:hypothetical protein
MIPRTFNVSPKSLAEEIMSPLEAMRRLIQVGRGYVTHHMGAELGGGLDEEEEAFEALVTEACDITTLMLDTALPIARWRCHVEVDAESKVRGKIKDEFTICAVSIHGILGGLMGLSRIKTNVRLTLWEQRKTSAEMLSGYQGASKSSRYRDWLDSLLIYDAPQPPVN